MGGNDPRQAPPPSAPPPTQGQQPVSVNAQVVIDNRQRGSLSAGYGAYAGQGYSPYLTDVSARFRNLAQYDPDAITRSAERYERSANNSVAFLADGQFVGQFTMVNGKYQLARVYDTTDPRPNGDRFQLDQTRSRLAAEQGRLDPVTVAGIQARHEFENLALNNPGRIAAEKHVYPNANNNSQTMGGEAYLVQEVGGRLYGGKYGFENGRFEMRQVFDLQDPTMARAFQEQESNAQSREITQEQRLGRYGSIPTPYPVGRGGADVGVVVGGNRGGSNVGVSVGTDNRGGVHVGGQVDVRIPGVGRIDVGIRKP